MQFASSSSLRKGFTIAFMISRKIYRSNGGLGNLPIGNVSIPSVWCSNGGLGMFRIFNASTDHSNAAIGLGQTVKSFNNSSNHGIPPIFKRLETMLQKYKTGFMNQSYHNSSNDGIPPIFKKLEIVLDRYKMGINGDTIITLDGALSLQKILQAALIVSGHKDHLLEHKASRLVRFGWAIEGYIKDGKLTSVLMIHLLAGFSDTTPLLHLKRIHALALKMVMQDREWVMSRVMGLYAEIGRVKIAETIFLNEGRKGITIYNSMIFIYSRNAPEKALVLFKEMLKTTVIRPTDVTFRALLPALSHAALPKDARDILQYSMKEYGCTPKLFHYGAVVDAYARMQTPFHIQEAVTIVKEMPLVPDQMIVHCILSRCYPPPGPSKEDLIKFGYIISIAQSFVLFLDEHNFSYQVIDKTYYRLQNAGLKWPESVTIMV